MMSDLPKERLDMPRVPFFNTGVNFFGPLMVRRGRSEQKDTAVYLHVLPREQYTWR